MILYELSRVNLDKNGDHPQVMLIWQEEYAYDATAKKYAVKTLRKQKYDGMYVLFSYYYNKSRGTIEVNTVETYTTERLIIPARS